MLSEPNSWGLWEHGAQRFIFWIAATHKDDFKFICRSQYKLVPGKQRPNVSKHDWNYELSVWEIESARDPIVTINNGNNITESLFFAFPWLNDFWNNFLRLPTSWLRFGFLSFFISVFLRLVEAIDKIWRIYLSCFHFSPLRSGSNYAWGTRFARSRSAEV